MQGAINVDIRKLDGVDVVSDVRKLPFKDGELEGIGSRNLIEHFSRNDIAPMVKEWARCIKKDGFIHIETVDAGRLMDKWQQIPEENMLDGLLGAQSYDENFHKMIFTKDILTRFLKEAGLTLINCEQFEHRGIPRIKVVAVKL
jgi:predicted SAM-dependent methyltransferase